ncbi:MAG: hypothetical protein KatS3mg108_1732 [Isosphaeraceae bacterium]|jgi:hypothetical protein|nr:MAG: hypothetical protein KatS3mg108_1732 [Isosphaeraceae bacterium]
MSEGNRAISALFLVGAAALVGLVAYALAPAGLPDLAEATRSRLEVAVFLPDLASWDALGRGARRAAELGVVRLEAGAPDRLSLRTPSGRRLDLIWHHPAGGWELAERLRSLLRSTQPPEAVIGSANTALTWTLARTLGEVAENGPPLLIPAASAIFVPGPQATGGRTPLLEIHAGRTFRFCLNNLRMAELVIDYLNAKDHPTAIEAFVLVDPLDPFSVDLAECFEQVLDRRGLAGLRRRVETSTDSSLVIGAPTIEEQRLVAPIAEAVSGSGDRPVWVLVTLQGTAAQRLLVALDRAVSTESARRIRVLSGDGLGLVSLRKLATQVDFPVYCVSSGAINEADGDDPSDRGRIEAEMIAALARAVDVGPGIDLATALARLEIRPGEPGSIGRSLRFRDGDRVGEELGVVYELRPDPVELWGHQPGADGWMSRRWDSANGWQVRKAPESP